MLRLNLLGAVDLVDAGRSRNGDLGGTKPLALLVFLAISGRDRPIRRDTAAALLWPESEQKNARASLSQALSQLRSVLGDDVIRSRGQEELDVDFNSLACDCFEFADLAKRGHLEAAVELYKGEFAHGLYVKESAEFDDWMSRERAFWRTSFADVLVKLYDAAVAANDLNRAAVWASKLLDVAPEKDEPVRALLALLAQKGNAPAALRLYEQYERTLDDAFGITPPADITTLIENLSRGPRVRPAERPRTLRIADPVVLKRRSKMAAVAVAGMALTFFAGTRLGVFNSQASSVSMETRTPRVAITQLAVIGNGKRSANVLSEALQWRMREAGFEVLDATSIDSSALKKLTDVDGTSGMTFVVGGEVEPKADGSLVARMWLNDAGSGKRLWESRFTQKEQNAHLIVTQLSEAVASEIRRAAGDAAEFALVGGDVSAESWRAVYRARERIEAASEMRLAGAVAGAETELKDAETILIELSERERDWALPWVLRGRLAESRALSAVTANDARRGTEELDKGIRLLDQAVKEIGSAEMYELRGVLEYDKWIFGVDDVATANNLLARAESDLRKALATSSQRSDSYAALSGVTFAQGKYAEAYVYARRAYESNVFLRQNAEVLTRLFISALNAGDDAAADQWCTELRKAHPRAFPSVLCRIQLAGFAPKLVGIGEVEREIENLDASPARRRMIEPKLKASYAISLAQVGMADSAHAVLAGIAGHSDPDLVLLRAFAFAALKDAPQSHALLRTYLSEYEGTRSHVLHMRWLN